MRHLERSRSLNNLENPIHKNSVWHKISRHKTTPERHRSVRRNLFLNLVSQPNQLKTKTAIQMSQQPLLRSRRSLKNLPTLLVYQIWL